VDPQTNHRDVANARAILHALPTQGLFEGHSWRVAPSPFLIPSPMLADLEFLGRVLLQFNRAVNLLYRLSVSGKQPEWISRWLDVGKPQSLIDLQRHPAFKNDLPKVIRPDLLLTESGFSITELDSVPGGIGLTAWLNAAYSKLPAIQPVVGGPDGMLEGFKGIFGNAPKVRFVVSEESGTYRPEMRWIAEQLGTQRFELTSPDFMDFSEGDAVYRFFELFDTANVPNAQTIFKLAAEKRIRLTPPPKPIFEEKMLFALLWNRNLHSFWRQELGEGFLNRLQKVIPYSWILDPSPLPPHAAIPRLNITDWSQLKTMSQRERDLILKVSGFSPNAWGARGVFLGSDLSTADWSAAVDAAIQNFPASPSVLQEFHKPRVVRMPWLDPASSTLQLMQGRARLCPYYFVHGEGENARAQLSGILATVCPADKKIIHGMTDAILAPVGTDSPAPPN